MEGSAPVSGSPNMTFRLYALPHWRHAGLGRRSRAGRSRAAASFYTALGDLAPFTAEVLNSLDQNLSGSEVSVEAVTLPRQRLDGLAIRLQPGAGR